MGFEIDFLPVGEEGKSGDAIALRFGNLFGQRSEQMVVVIVVAAIRPQAGKM